MSDTDSGTAHRRRGAGILLLLAFASAAAVIVFTYSSISKSRADSFALLRNQGVTLLETLTQATDNAVNANTFFWESFVDRIAPLARLALVTDDPGVILTTFDERLDDITALAIYRFDDRLTLTASAENREFTLPAAPLEEFFYAANELLSDSSQFQSLVFLTDSSRESASALYLELNESRDVGVCLVLDAPGLWEMENEAGIGRLIQRLGQGGGVRYILFQDFEGLVFASAQIDSVVSIASDSFLLKALEEDTVTTRLQIFRDEEILELVAPFSAESYADGLFRLGLSLEAYHTASSEFNRQMITLAVALFLIAGLLPLYVGLRRERRELGVSLARTQSTADAIVSGMRSGALALDTDGRIKMINSQLLEMLAIKEPISGSPNWRDTQLARRLPDNLLSQELKEAQSDELQLNIDGKMRYFLYSLSPILTESPQRQRGSSAKPEIVGQALVIYDYTRQKELEEESARKLRLAELGDLAANVAHEIRNPLNAISLAAQRIDAEYNNQSVDDDSDLAFFTSQIKSETSRLDSIVSRLLDLTRAPQNLPDLQEVGPLIIDWLRFMEPEFETDGATVSFQALNPATAQVDSDKLRQTLGNLYRNSLEALREGFSGDQNKLLKVMITVESSRAETTKTTSTETTSAGAKITFSDNGPGVALEAIGKIFTPYYTTRQSGSGLGLAISYRLIGDMGGTLEYDDQYTDGSRFVIILKGKSPETP